MDVLGRDAELARIDAWLRFSAPAAGPAPAGSVLAGPVFAGSVFAGSGPAASGPAGSVLVIEGEPGIGKTTLWSEAAGRAQRAGWQVLSCRPVPSDAGLPHVALTDLLHAVSAQTFESLPLPQRRPLEVALLRREAGEGDLEPRVVGTGLTALLGRLAQDRPLLLAIDDAQWLDPASARSLAFALRRLAGNRVRLVAAVRIEDAAGQRGGAFAAIEASLEGQAVSRIQVGPLSVASIHQMFRQSLGASFPRLVLVRIHRAAGGNAFYALEIAREVRRLGVPDPGRPLPVPGDHHELALLRLRRLPRASRDALTAVAAMSHPSTRDTDLEALAPAEVAGFIRVRSGELVEFTHPLFGSALYASLPEAARRKLHRDLAERVASLEEQARHLALAADGPDRRTAGVLDRAAAAAGARGAAEVAVELMELACRLTPPGDQHELVRRELELADRRYFAGDPTGARRELERSAAALPAGEDRARVLLELGSVLWAQGESGTGAALMSQALTEARTRSARARIHSRISAQSDDADVAVEHGEAALALLDEQEDPVMYCFALHNLTLFKLYAGHGADHAAIEKGMRLQQDLAAWEMSSVPAFWARNFDDFGTARRRFEDMLRAFRERGDEATVSAVLTHLARVEAMTGHIERARALAQEALTLAEQTEQETYLNMALCATAYASALAGELAEAAAAAEEMLRRLGAHPDAVLEGMARIVLGLTALLAGDLAGADRQLTRADEIETAMHNREPATNRFQADHAEAVIGLGDLARAEVLVQRLEARAAALPRPWINAVSTRSRGLLDAASGRLDEALADYQRALLAHQTLDMPFELGRTLLALGRLHRRRNERQRALACLDRAKSVFEECGARSLAAVTAAELDRTRGRRGSREQLTATERQICELAVAGLRNSEIAARLFLSGKTVEANLSRAYRKLGVRSRTELGRRLATPAEGHPGQT